MKLTIIRAVGARNQLLVSFLEREPRFQIVLLTRRQIQCARHDRDHPVSQPKALIELLAIGDHRIKHLPALLRLRYNELLDLLELMHAEYTPHVAASGASFFAETRGVAGVADGELLGWLLEPFVRVECGDGLFGGRDQVLLVFRSDDLRGNVAFVINRRYRM